MAKLTARGKALRWMTRHRNLTEQPPGSNRDNRKDGITAAQKKLGAWLVGQPWCGVWCCNAAMAGGVRPSKPYRWASVALIEDDARAKRNSFRGWTRDPSRVLRGDLVILFGRGVHVEMVRQVHKPRPWRNYWLIDTDGGNTSAEGQVGSQSNGGQSARRRRPMSAVHGFALVNYPG
jgi:hypothetical protein